MNAAAGKSPGGHEVTEGNMLPATLSKTIADALGEVLKPSARRIGAGLLALVEAGLRGNSKGQEEQLLDIVEGEIASQDRRKAAISRLRDIACDPNGDHQRILAREAARFVPAGNFIVPALPIAGRIFRESEFEEEGSPIWDMWAQLLARACDRDRVGEAHPSFPWIISQLSTDEAKLLTAMAPLQPRTEPYDNALIPLLSTSDIGIVADNVPFYLSHLGSLGIVVLPMGWMPAGHIILVDNVQTFMLNSFGHSFMSAVTQHGEM